jgi:ABC-type multidrug transport system fused ATPase/permease subunit
VQAAARDAEMLHIIEAMPHDFDTVIGSGSQLKLSGGQLARLGLARALCRRPRLLLLDEVTSALDPATEQQILATLRTISRTRPVTIIMVTHSIFAMQQTDRVIMLAGGRVAEQGKYQDLLDSRGAFWALAHSHI